MKKNIFRSNNILIKRKALSLVEYILIFALTSVVIATLITSFNADDFKKIFQYTFEFQKQTGTEVELGPLTY